jgi:hypothetical protein
LAEEKQFTVDVAQVHREERARWIKEEAPRRSFADIFGTITPYFIVVVAVVVYALSAPHTAGVMDFLSPGVGWLAPVGVELSIFYLAFEGKRRSLKLVPDKDGRLKPGTLPVLLAALRILMFFVAFATNFTGALNTVVHQAGINDVSGTELLARFGTLPVTVQAALVMVLVMAVIIPIVADVAGHGIADLVFEGRPDGVREQRWKKIEVQQTYRAVFVRYEQAGLSTDVARQRAQQDVASYFVKLSPLAVMPPSEQPKIADGGRSERPQLPAGQRGQTRKMSEARLAVREFIRANPDNAKGSVNEVWEKIKASGIQAGRTTVAEELAEIRNGHA